MPSTPASAVCVLATFGVQRPDASGQTPHSDTIHPCSQLTATLKLDPEFLASSAHDARWQAPPTVRSNALQRRQLSPARSTRVRSSGNPGTRAASQSIQLACLLHAKAGHRLLRFTALPPKLSCAASCSLVACGGARQAVEPVHRWAVAMYLRRMEHQARRWCYVFVAAVDDPVVPSLRPRLLAIAVAVGLAVVPCVRITTPESVSVPSRGSRAEN